jgi:hypothetical protein
MKSVQLVQNPGVGAALLWKFVLGYCEVGSPPLLPNLFLVLPIMLHSRTASLVNSTQRRTGLRGFAVKLAKTRSELLALHTRATRMRELSVQSLAVAESSNLLILSPTSTLVSPVCFENITVENRVDDVLQNSFKLGSWFAQHSLSELSLILRVYF